MKLESCDQCKYRKSGVTPDGENETIRNMLSNTRCDSKTSLSQGLRKVTQKVQPWLVIDHADLK